MYANSHNSLLGVEGNDNRWEWNANLVGRFNLLGEIDGESIAVDGWNFHLIDGYNRIRAYKVTVDAIPVVAFVLLVFGWTRVDWVVARLAILSPSAWCVVLPK